MHRVADCIIRRVTPQPPEWEHIGNQIDAAMIFAGADKISKAGWSLGCVSTVDSSGLTTFVADPIATNA